MNTLPGRSIVVATLLLGAAVVVQAGGWSVITVNNVPDYALAGAPLTLTFSVRQHGNNLLRGLRPAIHAATAGGFEVAINASPTTNEGEYSATLRLASPGEWKIRVDGGFNPDDSSRQSNSVVLPPLRVIRDQSEAPAPYSEAERGGRLIVTKGCVACHTRGSDKDLARKHFAANYLKMFLADPGIRTVGMPNLRLKETEISALTAFISGSRGSTTRSGR